MTLYWKSTGITPEDYTVFVHLLDASAENWGQGDGPPLDGDYPTRYWEPTEVIVDLHHVAVRADAPPGDYWLAVGFYRPSDGARQPAWDENGDRLADDRILLPIQSK